MAPVEPIPEHLHTITPRLVVRRAAAAIDFYRAAFDAVEIGERFHGPGGEIIHAELRIGDSVLMITEDTGEPAAPARSPEALGGMVSAVMATYWPDVDAAWDRAVTAGADIVYPLQDALDAQPTHRGPHPGGTRPQGRGLLHRGRLNPRLGCRVRDGITLRERPPARAGIPRRRSRYPTDALARPFRRSARARASTSRSAPSVPMRR